MITNNLPKVLKANGHLEPFDPLKLEMSLKKSKTDPKVISEIIEHISNEITEGTTTAQIYKHAFFLLHKTQKNAAKSYSLRHAVMSLGPAGFHFEKYIAEIFRSQGYTAETNQIVEGGCVQHEVDVVAWNEAKLIMTEAKFHNDQGQKTDLKVALYVKARFDDLLDSTHFYGNKRRKVTDSWLVTNTKFTSTAIDYGMCKGLTMIGWNFPGKGNLQDMIEDGDLAPVTVLTSIHKGELSLLLENNLVLCKQIRGNVTALTEVGIATDRAKEIVEELENF